MSSTPSTRKTAPRGAEVCLRDGSRVRVRPGSRADRDLLLRGFQRLSPSSRYRRFLAPTPELSKEMVRYLTEIDHHDHEALVAIDDRTGEGVGVARYVRDPERPGVAEVAVTVVDDWQGRGLGTILLEALCARARQEGIASFTAVMLAANDEMMELLRRLGPVQIVARDSGVVEIEVPIPEAGVAPALRGLLRLSATAAVSVSGPAVGSSSADGRTTTSPDGPASELIAAPDEDREGGQGR
ncbi:MAG: GNAT family N-acetyltransferase [Solirubrobacteraceae bacterium]